MGLTDILYWLVLIFIRIWKGLELLFLKLFSPFFVRFAKHKISLTGVIFHFSSDPKWTIADDKKTLHKLAKAGHKFDSLIHLNFKTDSSWLLQLWNSGTLEFAEKYIDGTWDTENLDQLQEVMQRLIQSGVWKYHLHPINRFCSFLKYHLFNCHTKTKAIEVVDQHYDLGNDLMQSFMGPLMQYNSGYWANASNLDEAQIHKMELIAKKLVLKPGMRVLDLGCGWGTLCKFLAEKYSVSCVGVNISKEGVKYAKEICRGLDVDIRLQDYRDVNEKFDRVVSIEMMEHIGVHNYREFFKVAHRCLTDNGIFMFQTNGVNHPSHVMPQLDEFYHKYIFPNMMFALPTQITQESFGLFIIEDWHNLGADFGKTFEAWRANFALNWPKISGKYDKKFYRMWNYYMCTSEAVFRTRRLHTWQIVMSKDGIKTDYRAAR